MKRGVIGSGTILVLLISLAAVTSVELLVDDDVTGLAARPFKQLPRMIKEILCKDSDRGINFYTYGVAEVRGAGGRRDCCKNEFSTNMGDFLNNIGAGGGPCVDSGPYLYEAFCKKGVPSTTVYECPAGCEEGVCIGPAVPPPPVRPPVTPPSLRPLPPVLPPPPIRPSPPPSVNTLVIEEDIGVFRFVKSGREEFCDLIIQGDCVIHIAEYDSTVGGVDGVIVGVESHTQSFSNQEAIEGLIREFGRRTGVQMDDEMWNGHQLIIFQVGDTPPLDIVIGWTSGTRVIVLVIDDWYPAQLDGEAFEDMLNAYLNLYPSDLEFETPPPPAIPECSDSDGGINYDEKGTTRFPVSTPTGVILGSSTDVCSDVVATDKGLIENYCENGRQTRTTYVCPGSCRDGACVSEVPPPPPRPPISTLLIEEDIGVFAFMGIDDSGRGCDILVKGECIIHVAEYRSTLGGVDGVLVGVETHTQSFSNQEAIDGLISEFGRRTGVQIGEERWNASQMIIFQVGDTAPLDIVVAWTSGTNIIIIAIDDWYPAQLDDDYFEDMLSAYHRLYPSDLEFETPPLQVVPECTDSDGGISYDEKGTVTFPYVTPTGVEFATSTDVCSDVVATGRGLVEHYCENGMQTRTTYVCPGICSDGACTLEGGAAPNPCINAGYKCTSGARGCGLEYKEMPFACGDPMIMCCEDVSYCGDGICDTEIQIPSPEDATNCPRDCVPGFVGTCEDSDGGLEYYTAGSIKMEGKSEVLEERGLRSSDGLMVVSPEKATLKIHYEQKKVRLNDIVQFRFGSVLINDITYYAPLDSRNSIEIFVVKVRDFCDGDVLTEVVCDPDFNEPNDYQFTCPNGCIQGACIS